MGGGQTVSGQEGRCGDPNWTWGTQAGVKTHPHHVSPTGPSGSITTRESLLTWFGCIGKVTARKGLWRCKGLGVGRRERTGTWTHIATDSFGQSSAAPPSRGLQLAKRRFACDQQSCSDFAAASSLSQEETDHMGLGVKKNLGPDHVTVEHARTISSHYAFLPFVISAFQTSSVKRAHRQMSPFHRKKSELTVQHDLSICYCCCQSAWYTENTSRG